MQHRVRDLEEACDVCADDEISGLSGLDGGVVSGLIDAAHDVVQPLVHFLERPAQAHAVLGHFERGGRNAAGVRRLGRADGDARRLQHGNGLERAGHVRALGEDHGAAVEDLLRLGHVHLVLRRARERHVARHIPDIAAALVIRRARYLVGIDLDARGGSA